MQSLVGYSGFVGSNLLMRGHFDGLYNSKNIEEAFGTRPDIVYYAGVPAAKFLANNDPPRDRAVVEDALENLRKIKPKKVVLISTVDVYESPNGRDESDEPVTGQAYGHHRHLLEKWVAEEFDSHIIRLPGLYGKNIKKNFIYDFISYIPSMLRDSKMEELSKISPELYDSYYDRGDGFWALKEGADRKALKESFRRTGFSALNFTDSRGVYQYYNLKYLYDNIQTVLKNDIRLMHMATEPINIGDLYRHITGEEFVNELPGTPPYYDFRTKNRHFFGGEDGYIMKADFIYEDIRRFVEEMGAL